MTYGIKRCKDGNWVVIKPMVGDFIDADGVIRNPQVAGEQMTRRISYEDAQKARAEWEALHDKYWS